jgi:DNA-binding beta-propeller fold protein YncE
MRLTIHLGVVLFAFTLALPRLHAQQGVPQFEVDPAWPKVPAQWKLGHPSSVDVDAQDRVFVLTRPRALSDEDFPKAAPPVMIFDAAGNYLSSWGGPGPGYDWVQREHGIHIDSKGFVWIGGNYCKIMPLPRLQPVWDDQYLKFTLDGKFVLQIGKPDQHGGNDDTRNFNMPADAGYYAPTNEIFVADGYGNHRVIVLDADTGAFKRMWGAFGNTPQDHVQCPPWDTDASEDAPQFSIVHAIRVSKDGTVYVADREYERVQTYSTDGKFLRQYVHKTGPFARNVEFSSDPEQRFLYVGGDKGIFVLDRKTLTVLGEIKPPGLRSGGHQIATDSKGNLYVAQNNNGVQKLVYKGMSR